MEISYSRFSPVAGEKTDITDSLTSIGVFAWLLLSNALPHHASADRYALALNIIVGGA